MKVGEKERERVRGNLSIETAAAAVAQQTLCLSSICSALYSAYCHRLSVSQSGSPFVKGLQSITTIRSTCYQQCSQSAFVCCSCAF